MDAVERRAAVLRAIVEEYVETAQPVASQSIAQTRSLGVSSATVRNDMTQLEREGYIVQPHTSAGRIPSEQGYRYFVQRLMHEERLPRSEQLTIRHQFHQVALMREQWLQLGKDGYEKAIFGLVPVGGDLAGFPIDTCPCQSRSLGLPKAV